jgi:hypothetical protein
MAEHERQRRRLSWWFTLTGWVKESAALVGAIGVLVAAGGAVVAFFLGGDEGAPRPVVARLTGPNDMSERAFFMRSGKAVISTQYAHQDGVSAVWRGAEGSHEAELTIDDRSDPRTGVTLLRLDDDETGPERRFETGRGAAMEPGDPVQAYISDTDTTDGEVVQIGARVDVEGVGVVDGLLVVGEVGRPTEGGTPLLDEDDRVVGMLFAEEPGAGRRTMVIPIEDIRAMFPEQFD